MKVYEILQETDIERLDAEVLLAFILKKDRSWLIAHSQYNLLSEECERFADYVNHRRSGKPLAYIVGQKEFYGRMFNVDQRVLIPRPSTEGLIDLVLKNKKKSIEQIDTGIIGLIVPFTSEWNSTCTIVDIGTGSGCIAIILALEIPHVRLIATDISPDALDVAKNNARRHGVFDRIEFRQGDLLDPIKDLNEPFFIVSNPPYISIKVPFTSEWNFEPVEALFGGQDGTDVIVSLVKEAKRHQYCRAIALECAEDQRMVVLQTCEMSSTPSVRSVSS
jgi:release factor glutamine methyltransferase